MTQLLFFLVVCGALGQKVPEKPSQAPMVTTVCKFADNPGSYNNKLVEVRGYLRTSSEYSLLLDEHCSEKMIWFSLADSAALPGLEATVSGRGKPGGKNAQGQPAPLIPMRLVRDSSFEQLHHYLDISAKAEACANGPPPAFPPDCTVCRVTATFTGRVDGVSKAIHEAHLKRSNSDGVDGKGFGHTGMFDAQIVVRSVANVSAVDESELRVAPTKQP
jgi:hypothetical protein